MTRFSYILPALLLLTLFNSCEKTESRAPVLSDSKEILNFHLRIQNGSSIDSVEATVSIGADSIIALIPAGVNRTSLIPIITISGVQVIPVSGVALDFSAPVTFTVTAEDGSTKNYTAVVNNAVPVIQEALVYFGNVDGGFYALDALTGALKWRRFANGGFSYAAPAYSDGKIYTTNTTGTIYCYDALTGSTIWEFSPGGTQQSSESSPTIANGAVFFGVNSDEMISLDATTGALRWRFQAGQNVSTSAVIHNGVVYFSASDSKAYAVDFNTGQLIWQTSIPGSTVFAGPTYHSGTIYTSSGFGFLHALNAATGAQNWRFSADSFSLSYGSPAIVDNVLFIGSANRYQDFTRKGSLYAINATNGQLVWQALDNIGFYTSPSIEGDRLFIAGYTGLYAVNRHTGALIWEKLSVAPNSASPLVANGIVYQGSGGSHWFFAFNAATGAELWRYPSTSNISAPLVVYHGSPTVAYHSSRSGMIQ